MIVQQHRFDETEHGLQTRATGKGDSLRIVIIGLTITSSWGNGHATTYRGLVRELVRRGHDVLFLEHDKPWYAGNRDLPDPPFGRTVLYNSTDDLARCFSHDVRDADLVIVGSYVPEGVQVGRWVTAVARGLTAFYDIDTPVTLAKLRGGDYEYLSPDLIPRYDLYLSFTGGPTLDVLEREFGSPRALPLYCSVDPSLYFPDSDQRASGQPLPEYRWDLGYLGTYSPDRQPPLEKLLIEPARRMIDRCFVVAGPQYPDSIQWPPNVQRIAHLPPAQHRAFYNGQSFTLNVTRADMIRAGYSPSVRLFEAAACGVAIISDAWDGLSTFFTPGEEIFVAHRTEDVIHILRYTSEAQRRRVGERARAKVLSAHTAAHRAAELESYALSAARRTTSGFGAAVQRSAHA
ncbi:MAG TPA: glycosyltransferase [Tepidisphaeraceae bacterium]|nr:glycosyltransferase [Tepidisphaeraceae bacterium]